MKRRMKSRDVPVVNSPFLVRVEPIQAVHPGGVGTGLLGGDICATVAALAWRANSARSTGGLAHAPQYRPA